MADETHRVKISGVGSNQIDIEVLDQAVRDRLMECIRKNGKISIMVGRGQTAGIAGNGNGFAQQVD